MNGQTTNINYSERRKAMEKYIETHDPYHPAASTIDLHALTAYADQKNIPLSEVKEEDILKFKRS
ncbi:MAG: hypothetical protein LUE16_02270 [Lachnospiraceae bacterium]|nr:hypothetical protein [Lachnospiraceae bacterium]